MSVKNIKYGFYVILFTFFIAGCSEEEPKSKGLLPAKFVLPYNNTSIQKGKTLPIEVLVDDFSTVENLKIYTSDTVVFDGKPTKKNYSYILPTKTWNLGTTQVSLEAKLNDGSKRKDNRVVRVLSDIFPTDYLAEVINAFPHSTSSYTQGLEFDNGTLYEGTGGMGATGGTSFIAKVNYKTGEITQKFTLESKYFGEGISIIGDKLYQLTWQQNICFVYDKNSFEKIEEFSYSGEGWGLCNDGNFLIMSDGTERLYFRDPNTFGLKKTLEVYSNSGPVRKLNELEYINGKIYANVYQSNNIMIIDPKSGAVEGIIDASLITLEYRGKGEVLNGIAYQNTTDRLFITGKNWPNLLEISVFEQ